MGFPNKLPLWINDNSAARILWKDYKKLLKEPTPIQERSYSKEEISKIRDFLKKKHTERPKYIPAYALEFQLLTGMRRGEIPPLRWEDVDFEAGTIYIHQELISQQCKRAGNVVLTAQMFGNSPETIRKHYYVGEDIERKREILNMRSFS